MDTERTDSTGRPRTLKLAWLEADGIVNIKVENTSGGSPRDLIVRVLPQRFAEDLNMLQIPGLHVEYRPPVKVPTKVGAIVIDGDNAFVRVEGPRAATNQAPWRLAGRSDWRWDSQIGEYLNRGQGIRATVAFEGVDL